MDTVDCSYTWQYHSAASLLFTLHRRLFRFFSSQRTKDTMAGIRPIERTTKKISAINVIYLIASFLGGCAFCSIILSHKYYSEFVEQHPHTENNVLNQKISVSSSSSSSSSTSLTPNKSSSTKNILNGKNILVAIAAFDFSQIPHLEDVLDGYRDVCESGARVDVVIHTTVPWPVSLIDLLNTRLYCTIPDNFNVKISIHSPALRLHLVDLHRTLFYDQLEKYDLFVYTEDDIRVRPTTLAAYLEETNNIIDVVGEKDSSNYNVGIVRYELNFPTNVIIDDKTRHATQDVTRVYWEHLAKPVFPKAVRSTDGKLTDKYVSMGNAHQGMFIATRDLLKAWKVRNGCQFDVVRDRPGMKNKPSQPTEGTQRVWMSSKMLFGSKHCNVQQLLPIKNFGALTVVHLPNKNYRRVGKQGRIGGDKEGAKENYFSDGTEVFEKPDPSLLTAMELHLQIQRNIRHQFDVLAEPSEYQGIIMVDEIEKRLSFKGKMEHRNQVDEAMRKYRNYVDRGGYLIDTDYANIIENQMK